MDNGGTKPDDNTMPDGDNFELEVSDKDTELVSADIESSGDEVDQLPVDDTELVMGDMPEPHDPADEPAEEKKPEEEPKDEPKNEAPADEEKPEADDFDNEELDNELDELEAEEKADENSEDTTVAEEEKPEEEPKDEAPADEEKPEEPTEEEKTDEEPEAEESKDEVVAEEETKEEASAEEKPEEEPKDEAPAEEEKPEADGPIVVEGQNAPVDSTQANSTFPVSPAKETKDNRSKIGLFIMIAVIVLLLIGCGIFALLSGGKKSGGSGGNGGGNGGDEEPPISKVEGMSEFDVQLLKDFAEEDNIVYSPMSIKYAMSMLIDGTDGDTKKEITDIIGSYNPTDYTSSDHLSIANALFVRDDFKNMVKTSYTDAIKEKYGANTIYDPFNNASTINDWVYTNTLSLIPKILDDDDLTDAVFVIANTVAIDMEWDNVIQCGASANRVMNCFDGRYSVEYMHEDYFDYVKDYEDENRAKVSLNNKDALGMEFAASINNYDIVKVLGEDKIRNTVKAAYEKCLAEHKNQYECDIEGSSIDEYLDNYIKDINKNYGKVDASTGFKMYVGNDVKMFAKNFKEYDGTTLQYVSIMPTSGTLGEFIENTSLDNLKTLIGSLKEIKSESFADGKVTRIRGVVPEYDYNKDYSLIDEFRQLGVEKVFTSDADLSKMLEEEAKGVDVVKINHSAKIQFTNFGVKAAAATSIVGAGAAAPGFDYLFDVPVEEIDLTFDKPFLYMIRDTKTGEIWFMGTVYEGKEYK